jgi:hypothetical protein
VRRLRRILFNAASVLSLVLCVGAAGSFGPLSVRSISGEIQWAWSAGAWISFWVSSVPTGTATLADTCRWHALGLGFDVPGPFDSRYRVVTPHWFVVLMASLLPGLWVGRAYAARRKAGGGRCPGCGYDLRATPERCPECGMVPRAAAGNVGLDVSIARPKPLLRIAVVALTVGLGALGFYTWWAGVGGGRTLSLLCLGVVLGLLYTVRGGSLPSIVYRFGGTAITADADRRNLSPKFYLPILMGVAVAAVAVYYFFAPKR